MKQLRAAVIAALTCASARAVVPADIGVAYDHPVPANAGQARPIVVAPDGRSAVYSIIASSNPQEAQPMLFLSNGSPETSQGMSLWLVDLATRQSRPICPGRGASWDASFSPDGTQLAFYSDRDGEVRLWTSDIASGGCRPVSGLRIKSLPWPYEHPRWSIDGTKIYVPTWPDQGPGSYASATRNLSFTNPPASGAVGVTVLRNEPKRGAAGLSPSGPDDGFETRCAASGYMAASIAAVNVVDGTSSLIVRDDEQSAADRGGVRNHPSPWFNVSPTGRWISYYASQCLKPGSRFESMVELFIVPASGGVPIRLATGIKSPLGGPEYDFGYRWSPHNDDILFIKDGGLFKVSISAQGAGQPQRLGGDLGHLVPSLLRISSDGMTAYVGVDEQHWHDLDYRTTKPVIARVSLNSRPSLMLPAGGDLTVTDILSDASGAVWQDTRGVIASATDTKSGEAVVAAFNFDKQKVSVLFHAAASLGGMTSAQGKALAIYQDFGTPPDLFMFDNDWRGKNRLSQVAPGLAALRVGTVESFHTQIPYHDGTLRDVRSTVLLPPGAKRGDRLPTIVWFYPSSDLSKSLNRFGAAAMDDIAHVFTARGYAVLLTDVPLGPGNEKGNVIDEIVDALLPQVYHAVDLGYADPSRLAIRGQSFGGFATAAIITRTNLFRAAIASSGVYDLGGAYGEAHFFQGQLVDDSFWMEKSQPRLGESVWDDPMRYIANSPYYRADEIHTPLLILQGTNDPIGFNEGPKLFAALRRLDRSVDLALYEGAGHQPGAWRAEQAQDQATRTLDFLAKNLSRPNGSAAAAR